MTRDRVRFGMIALIAVAAVLSVVGRTLNNVWIGQVATFAYLCSVAL